MTVITSLTNEELIQLARDLAEAVPLPDYPTIVGLIQELCARLEAADNG